jgi:hypothetical protein
MAWWWFDRPLMHVLTRNWDESAIKEYPERVRKHEGSIPAPIAEALQGIDAKATGLLQHVSMMIAGLGLMAPLVANHNSEVAIVIFAMAVYLIISLGCLRCLIVFNPPKLSDDARDVTDHAGRELLLRRELYDLCIRASIGFTIVMLVMLPTLYIW